MKLSGVVKKEFKEIIRDKGFILALILLPLILMLIFGYAYQDDIRDLDTIVIRDDNSEYSEGVYRAIEDSKYFNPISFSGSLDEAKELLKKSKIRVIFHIPQNFGPKLKNATHSEISLYLDSSDYIYNVLQGASAGVIKDSLKDIVQLIVADLESERDLKQERVDEIQELLDSVDSQAKNTLNEINNLTKGFTETSNLLRDTESKVKGAEDEIEKIKSEVNSLQSDVEATVDSLNDLKVTLEKLRQINPLLSNSIQEIIDEINIMQAQIKDASNNIEKLDPSSRVLISTESYNLNQLNQKLDSNKEHIDNINNTANELEQTYRDIQERMDTIHLELKSLKKEFLSSPVGINQTYLFGEVSYFQYLTPAIMTLILFFIGVVLTTLNIVDERNTKTLFRIATTPLKKIELLGAKFIVFFLVGFIEIIYVLLLAIFWFDVQIAGSLINVILVLSLLMASSIGLGLLISLIVKTMRQAVMVVPLIIVPSILISQIFSPIEIMPKFMQNLAYASPMFYSNTALREVMIKGTHLSGIINEITILGIYALIALLLGVLISKKRIE